MTVPSDRLATVRAAIANAAKAARRDSAEITLVAVSKGQDATAIEALIEAGQRDFGENRIQEVLDKWPALLARHQDVRLHFIGRLQSNKALDAVRLFSVIHSVDRPSLVGALAQAAATEGRSPALYLQVNIGAEEQKGGCAIADVPALAAAIRDSNLDLAGLMAIPPQGGEAAPYFALLAKLAACENLGGLSMGMSGDYREAVMLGATAVRVGRALFEE
ncbi:MAG: YggS family pyridoxal phosphate-dependent enzyme [Sphingomicrobium sp.]